MGSLPGFDAAPPGSYYLYWQMRRFSTIVLAHTIVWAPVFAGTQTIEIIGAPKNEKFAEKVKAAAQEDFLPGVMDWLPGMAECQHFGHFLQEVEWDRRIAHGPRGLSQRIARRIDSVSRSIPPTDRLPGGRCLSRCPLRAARGGATACRSDLRMGPQRELREEWWRVRQGEANADKMERKASGIQMGLGVPIGATFTNDDGSPVLPQDMAKTIINAAAQGMTFTFR